MEFTQTEKRFIDKAICYLLSNSDHEPVAEFFEDVTGDNADSGKWEKFVETIQKKL